MTFEAKGSHRLEPMLLRCLGMSSPRGGGCRRLWPTRAPAAAGMGDVGVGVWEQKGQNGPCLVYRGKFGQSFGYLTFAFVPFFFGDC